MNNRSHQDAPVADQSRSSLTPLNRRRTDSTVSSTNPDSSPSKYNSNNKSKSTVRSKASVTESTSDAPLPSDSTAANAKSFSTAPSSTLLAAVNRPPLSISLPPVSIKPNVHYSHHSQHSHGYHHHHHQQQQQYHTDTGISSNSAAAPYISPQENNATSVQEMMISPENQQTQYLYSNTFPISSSSSSNTNSNSVSAINSTSNTQSKKHNDSVVSTSESNTSTVASRSSSIITMSNPSSSSSSLNTNFKFQQQQQKLFSFNLFNLHSKTINVELVTDLLLNFISEDKIPDIFINKSDYEFCSAILTSPDYSNLLKLSNSLNGFSFDGVQLATSSVSMASSPYYNEISPYPQSFPIPTEAQALVGPDIYGYPIVEGIASPKEQDIISDSEDAESGSYGNDDEDDNTEEGAPDDIRGDPSVLMTGPTYNPAQLAPQYSAYPPAMPYYLSYGQMYPPVPGIYPGTPISNSVVPPGIGQGIISPTIPLAQMPPAFPQNAQYYKYNSKYINPNIHKTTNNFNNNYKTTNDINNVNNNNNNHNTTSNNRNFRSLSASFANLNINRDVDHFNFARSNHPVSPSDPSENKFSDDLMSTGNYQYNAEDSYNTNTTRYSSYPTAFPPQPLQQPIQQDAMRYAMRGSPGYNNYNYYFKSPNQQGYYPINKMPQRSNNSHGYYNNSRANSVRHYKNRYQMSELGNNYYSILHPEIELDEGKISPSSSYIDKKSNSTSFTSSANNAGSSPSSNNINVENSFSVDDNDDDLVFSPTKHVSPTRLFIGNIPFTSTFENLYFFLATTELKKGLNDQDTNSTKEVEDEDDNTTIIAENETSHTGITTSSDESNSNNKSTRSFSLSLQRQPDGTSRGYAILDANSDEQAQLLILNFNGSLFESRELTVRYDRLPRVIARYHYNQNFGHAIQNFNNINNRNLNRRYGSDGIPL